MRLVDIRIVHGDIETDIEMRALERVRKVAEKWWRSTTGTNDTTTIRISADGLEPVLAVINKVKRSWWQITVNEVAQPHNEADLKAAIARHPSNSRPPFGA